MSGDADAVRAALRLIHHEGPWHVCAKQGKGFTGRVFGAGSDGEAAQWAVAQNRTFNTYVSVAALRPDFTGSKATKDDVASVGWLWVDIDPRKGEPLKAERERILALLTTNLPEGVPPPSVIIDSGRGFWGLWRLAKPVVMPDVGSPGWDEARAKVEDRNRGLERAFGADSCHNLERVMRLPGTVNHKAGAGLARVVGVDDTAFDLAAFPSVPDPKAGAAAVGAGRGASVRAADLDAIPPLMGAEDGRLLNPSALERAIIMHGMPPDELDRFPSRSEAMFHVLCARIRAGVPNDVLAAMLLDESLGISAHVREQGEPSEYVARQIKRAHEVAIDPELAELNLRHAVLENEQGKTRVLEFVRASPGNGGEARSLVTLQSFEDFRNRYMNRLIQVATDKDGNAVKKPLGEAWLRWPNRRQHHSLVFAPGEGEEVGNQLNLWRGFGVVPKAGDWTRMRDHVRNILAAGDEDAANYILRWAAFAVQNPEMPAEVALVFRGKKGTGKGLFARALVQMFGQHGLHICGGRLLTGRFNLHLRDCCLLFADEVEWRGDREAEAALKVMITEPSLQIEGKGTNSFASPNHLHIVMASNEDWVVPASIDERRFAAFHVSDGMQGNDRYFSELVEQMEGGGLAAMLHDLLARDLKGWHPRRDIPQTGELMAQKLASLSGAAAIVHELLMRGETPPVEREDGQWPTLHDGDAVFVPTSDLMAWALERRLIREVKPGLGEQVGHELKRAAPPEWEGRATRETVQGRQVRGRWLPALPVARRLWAEARGVVVEWGEGSEAAWDVVRGPLASRMPF